MYKKDFLKEWFGLHLTECSWYLDYSKDCTPFLEVSLCESFELGFKDKTLETHVYEGPKRSRDSAFKKGKGKSATLETMVGIKKLHDDFPALKI
jgi:hypothetical protein